MFSTEDIYDSNLPPLTIKLLKKKKKNLNLTQESQLISNIDKQRSQENNYKISTNPSQVNTNLRCETLNKKIKNHTNNRSCQLLFFTVRQIMLLTIKSDNVSIT